MEQQTTGEQIFRSERIGVPPANFAEVCPPNPVRKFLAISADLENISNADPANMPYLAVYFDRITQTDNAGIMLYPLHCVVNAAGNAYIWSGCEKLLMNQGEIPKGRIYVRNFYGLGTIYIHILEY
jgi:hypothetical protein